MNMNKFDFYHGRRICKTISCFLVSGFGDAFLVLWLDLSQMETGRNHKVKWFAKYFLIKELLVQNRYDSNTS